MIVGYARVSTDGQTLDAQHAALIAAGAERVFAEKVSGAVTDRKALARAIATLGAGDVLLVTRLDRLARSTRDLLNVLDTIAKGWRGLQVASRRVGRHHHRAWEADADDLGRSC
jgi:DNA invertase Pin-like site-specific DNA recombinase